MASPPIADDAGLRRRVALRLLAAIVPVALIVFAIRATGLLDAMNVDGMRALLETAGFWRVPVFILVYGVGILAYVPGSVFVAAGVLVFGPGWGLVWSYLGAALGNLLSFGIVRWTGYRPLARGTWPLADRLFMRLAARPIAAVALIRLVFPTTAPINYALALTDLRLPAYLAGSLVGVVPQLVACVWLFAWVFE